MNISFIIFDLDGTLIDAFQAVVDSFNFALAQLGKPVRPDEEIQRCVGQGERRLIEQLISPDLVDAAIDIYRDHHKAALRSTVKFLPGVPEVLTRLYASGTRMAIASNRPSYFTHIILEHLKIDRYFSHVLCADQVPNPKPEPDMLEQLMEQAGFARAQTLFVGDTMTDMLTGYAARVKTVGVCTGPHTKEELEIHAPFRIIDRLSDLLSIVY